MKNPEQTQQAVDELVAAVGEASRIAGCDANFRLAVQWPSLAAALATLMESQELRVPTPLRYAKRYRDELAPRAREAFNKAKETT